MRRSSDFLQSSAICKVQGPDIKVFRGIRRFAGVILWASLFLLVSSTVQSQEPQAVDTISIDTNLISVPVIVSDRDNRYLPNLKVEAFHLFDNQVEQKISYFDTGEEP